MTVPNPLAHTEVDVAGERLWLLPERAAFWAARRMLLVADPHYGKAATFRASGMFVPTGTTAVALGRLDAMIAASRPERVVFLGDFLHARRGRSDEVLSALGRWRERHGTIEMLLVRGNHDRGAGDPPSEVGVLCADGPVREGPFALVHHPQRVAGGYALAGHLHPCVALRGTGRQRARLPCFWMGAEVGVLPAFGEFTGCSTVHPAQGDRVWAIAEGVVVPVLSPSPMGARSRKR